MSKVQRVEEMKLAEQDIVAPVRTRRLLAPAAPSTFVAIVLAVALGTTGCSDDPSRARLEPVAEQAARSQEQEAVPEEQADTGAGVVEAGTEDSRGPSTSNTNASSDRGEVAPKAHLQPIELPFEPKLPIEAWVDDPCVKPGGKVVLHVEAPHKSGIAYQAMYSDGQAGADEPMGAGYGGNDKGYGPPTGEWISTWVVSLDAPAGRARVDVFVGHRAKWGYDDPHFAVADDQGNCPQKWLKESKRDGS